MSEKEIELTKEELEELIKEKKETLKKLEIIGKGSEYIKELSDISLLQLEAEQYSEAEKNYSICLKYFEKQRDRLGQSAVLGVLGILYFKKGEYGKSIEYYEKSYEIYKELNQIAEVITCLKGIGNCYIKLNKLDKACDIFLECSSVCSDNKDIYSLLDCLGNLIYIHELLEKWDVVFELYKKTLEAFKELGDNQGIIVSYFNMGLLQKKNKNSDEALRYFKKGTNQAIDSNFSDLIIKGLGYIGETLFYMGKIKDAKNEFIKALHLAEKVNAKNAIIQIKILLKSFGLGEKDIKNDLEKYQKSKNKT